jgi:hypothetical protein
MNLNLLIISFKNDDGETGTINEQCACFPLLVYISHLLLYILITKQII